MSVVREMQLPNGRVSWNLGFGCAGILRLPLARQRERLLRTVLEEGITHFDVARMYGAGAAEGILGACLQGRRDEVTIGTKFGLPCGVPSPRAMAKQAAMRWAVNLHPALKKFLKGRSSGTGDRHFDYSVAEMKSSLTTSLAQLRTDHVDLFFLHEPRQADGVPGELAAQLQREQDQGRIGAYGLSAMVQDLAYFARKRPELLGTAVQFPMSLASPSPHVPVPYNGLFHVLADSLPQLAAFLARERDFARLWAERLDVDFTQRDQIALVLLAMGMAGNPAGMTLFFTSKPERVRRLVRGLRDRTFSVPDLLDFRLQLASRLDCSHAA